MGNTSSAQNKTVLVATVAGIVTLGSGAISLWLLYDRLNRATRLDSLKENLYNIEQLHSAIDTLRREIEELKAAKLIKSQQSVEEEIVSKKSAKVVRFSKTNSYLSSSDTEYLSAWSENGESSDDFYDLPEDDAFEDTSELNLLEDVSREEPIELFEKADVLLEGTSRDHEVAYQLLSSYENEYGANAEFLWRICRACRMTAVASMDKNREKELSYIAVEYGKRAVEADNENAEAHKWFAIAVGGTSAFANVSEKIKVGAIFKSHIDEALKMNPHDPVLYHLLGRFTYEVSTLSWIERKVAAALFSEMPSGSIEDALSYFQKAETLRAKPWKVNSTFIAKCLVQQGQYAEAMRWVDLSLDIPVLTAEDQTSQEELQALQRKYNSYR